MPGIRITRSTAAMIAGLAVALLSPAFAPAEAAPSQEPSRSSAPPASLPLDALLAKAAEYCRRLESSAFDLACREEIRETIDPKLDASQKAVRPGPGSRNDFGPGAPSYLGPTLVISTVRKVKRSFVYDYRCIRAGRAIREVRNQVEENGKRKIVPNAELQTSNVVFGTAFLGPVGLFGEHVQPGTDYVIAGRDRIGDIPVVIIAAKPKPGAPDRRNLTGKAWVDPSTGQILKIEWSESRVGRFDVFEKRGELFKRTPRLVSLSEFSAEKNGIRFPSRLYVEEAYLKESGKAFIRSKTEAVYKDFQFFSVEFEVHD
ncbi:MAG: hypothetical protein WCC00_14495 [Candidatus Aminicenantales bacterium]